MISDFYTLNSSNVDLSSYEDDVQKISSINTDFRFEIFSEIPENLLNYYVEFSIEADKNTIGLSSNRNNNTVESIKKQYEIRDNRLKLYYIIIAFNSENKIIAILNSDGLKNRGIFKLHLLYVTPKYRKFGIGEILIKKTIITSLKNNPTIDSFITQVLSTNTNALKLIKKLGFDICT